MTSEAAKRPGFSYLSLALYAVVYVLYVWKYSLPNRPFPTATLGAFGIVVPLLVLTAGLLLRRFGGRVLAPGGYWTIVILIAAGLTAVMMRFDPSGFAIGRLPAINDWTERLLHGINPYTSPTKPSALPFWFLLAAPFAMLGEPGLLQVAAFVAFAWAVRRSGNWRSTVPVGFMVVLPLFLFEVVVRSDLLSNTVLILVYLELLRRNKMSEVMSGAGLTATGGLALKAPDLLEFCLWGLLGGLVAATRGIALVALAVFLPQWMRRNNTVGNVAFLVSGLVGLVGVILPFALWDWKLFWSEVGPVAVQLSHTPLWMPLAALVAATVVGTRLNSAGSAYRVTALILFAVVAVKMVQCLVVYGVNATVMYDERFDPAYFAFCIPFALAGMMERE